MSKFQNIAHTILDGNLTTDGTPTRSAVDRLAQKVADALAKAFPGARVEVEIRRKTSGSCPADRFYPEADFDDERRASEVEATVYQEWIENLTDADMGEV